MSIPPTIQQSAGWILALVGDSVVLHRVAEALPGSDTGSKFSWRNPLESG